MITDLTVVDQRHKAVLEVLDHCAKITDVAVRYGVDRKTIYRWITRYQKEGLGALANRSSKPERCPHQICSVVEDRIVELRRADPDRGARTIRNMLRKELDLLPSISSVHRCLLRYKLVDHKPRRRRPKDYKRWERSRAMELWQADVMSVLHLVDGMHLQLVTGLDDHSRFCVLAKLLPRATAKPICDAFLEALNRYGLPQEVLTDNGRVFTGKLHRMPTNVLFDRICVNSSGTGSGCWMPCTCSAGPRTRWATWTRPDQRSSRHSRPTRGWGNRTGIVICLDNLAAQEVARRRFQRAVRLAGASDAVKETGGEGPQSLIALPDPRQAAMESLSDAEIAAEWDLGRAMTSREALEYAREEEGR